ncbi:MAG: choice-of-anchor B family protein [Actinobacteria bacterium]|nr:choice-of-anchor B family protein [Actinomycetota bacterium]
MAGRDGARTAGTQHRAHDRPVYLHVIAAVELCPVDVALDHQPSARDHATALVHVTEHANAAVEVDVADLDAPRFVRAHEASTPAIDHNLYVRGSQVYEANYRAGLRILDLKRVAEGRLREVAYFDVYPPDDAPEFNGAWSSYPFFPSGTIVVNGIEQGLFVLREG